MKKWISIVLFLLLFFSIDVFAERQILIDFNNLKNTELDIVKLAGPNALTVADADKDKLLISLDPNNWEVQLSPSARTIENIVNSLTKAVVPESGEYKGQTVLGARIHFPTGKYAAWAKIMPPYEIPSYEAADANDKIGNKYVNKGVLRNVGPIKTVMITVKGRNFPHSLTIRLKNQNDEYIDIFVGYLDFNGWRTFRIDNPNYIADVRKRNLKKFPLYPQEEPYVKLDSFIVYKYSDGPGGDFIIYIKSVEIIYDLAVLTAEEDINDELVWGILAARREAKKRAEAARVGIIQLLRFEEKKKMATESAEEKK
jgi:hypothetical protein